MAKPQRVSATAADRMTRWYNVSDWKTTQGLLFTRNVRRASRIRRLMVDYDVSAEDVAEVMDVAISTVYYALSGRRIMTDDITAEYLNAVVKARR